MIELAQAKLHLRVDIDADDAAIETMIVAATAAAADYLNVTYDDMELLAQPIPVEAAILLMIGDLYENRERQSERPLHGNVTYERLLNPYRVMAL